MTAGKVKRSLPGAFAFIGVLLRQMHLIAGARVVVLEGYCVAASVFKHRPGTCIVQMWHSLDAFKKFGFQILDLPSGTSSKMAKLMRMHQGYSHIICASAATEPLFKAAFQAERAQFVRLGLPRMDYISSLQWDRTARQDCTDLCDSGLGCRSCDSLPLDHRCTAIRESILHRYPELSGRPVVVYAPTFRDGRPTNTSDLIHAAKAHRFSLVLKLHPLEQDGGGAAQMSCIADKDFQTTDWFALADAVITDYSGIALESAIAGIPTFLYLYDAKDYVRERGLNIDFTKEAIAKYIYVDAAKMLAAIDQMIAPGNKNGFAGTAYAEGAENIKNTNVSECASQKETTQNDYDLAALKAFRDKYAECDDTGNTEKLAAFLADLINPQEVKYAKGF